MEAKYDSRTGRTGKIFFELYHSYSQYGYERDGWGRTSQATDLFYLATETSMLYIFKMEELRQYFEKHRKSLYLSFTGRDGYK